MTSSAKRELCSAQAPGSRKAQSADAEPARLQQHHGMAPQGRGLGAFGVWSTPPDGKEAVRSDATGPKPGRGQKLLKVGKYLISAESRKVVALTLLLSWSSVQRVS